MSQASSTTRIARREGDGADGGGGADSQAPARERSRKRSKLLRPLLMIGGVAVIVGAVVLYWLFTGGSVYVTDTYIKARRVQLSTDVSGLVESVAVHDNEHVKKGQVLVRLDPSRFKVAIAQAKAKLGEVTQQVTGYKHSYEAQLSQIKQQQAMVHNDKLNYQRYAKLIKSGGVTQSQYDNAKYTLQADQAKLAAMQAQANVDLARLSGDPKINVKDTPQYQAAEAALNQAQLNYKHSVIRAPFAGVVTGTDKLNPGMFLQAGTAAFALVSQNDIWVRSQPKETQLTWVRTGDKVDIHVDAYPGKVWHGVVKTISPASGSSFSLLPAQNSSGNWVKVVQRIPLRVEIQSGPKNLALRNGMSAEITGHQRSLSELF
jgi:membrane fusion protein (multidrug efflux system)